MATKRNAKLSYKSVGFWKEDHGLPLWGVSINNLLGPDEPIIFATVGHNRVTVYEAMSNGDTKILQCYGDPDPDEIFYTCAWSYDPIKGGKPILAAAGARGVIRIFDPATYTCPQHFIGHGQSVNELKFHPKDPYILLSASKDHSLRLWNVKSKQCVAIFGGVDGHRDQVLSTDFDPAGDQVISCGMDHSLKIWKVDDKLKQVIKDSHSYDSKTAKQPFQTELRHFPYFSTREIHTNYVDCVRFWGDFVLSKSIDNFIAIWKPGCLNNEPLKVGETKSTMIHKLEYSNVTHAQWFVRFAMDAQKSVLALGNQKGKIFLWDMDSAHPTLMKPTMLSNTRCTACIRQTSFSRDGNLLICVCDDGSIWRWERSNYDFDKNQTPARASSTAKKEEIAGR